MATTPSTVYGTSSTASGAVDYGLKTAQDWLGKTANQTGAAYPAWYGSQMTAPTTTPLQGSVL